MCPLWISNIVPFIGLEMYVCVCYKWIFLHHNIKFKESSKLCYKIYSLLVCFSYQFLAQNKGMDGSPMDLKTEVCSWQEANKYHLL